MVRLRLSSEARFYLYSSFQKVQDLAGSLQLLYCDVLTPLHCYSKSDGISSGPHAMRSELVHNITLRHIVMHLMLPSRSYHQDIGSSEES